MSKYVSNKIRTFVFERAKGYCEYCLIHESATLLVHEIDHSISIKHNGKNETDNLALACYFCNRNKGTDIGSRVNTEFYRFYNPRIDLWNDHFKINDLAFTEPISLNGASTESILSFNEFDRLIEKQILIRIGNYPMNKE